MLTREERAAEVRSTFPEIAQITDPILQEKVVEIWVEAWEESTWETLGSIPKNISDAAGLSLVGHIRVVAQICLAYASSVGLHDVTVDVDLLLAGALLHDVSKLIEYEYLGPEHYGKTPVGNFLQHGVWGAHKAIDKHLSWPLVHLIVTHTRESGMLPKTVEGIILHYVDFMDTDVLLHTLNKPILLRR